MKTGLIVVGSLMVVWSALYHVCIYMEKQERELVGMEFLKVRDTTVFWLLPLLGVGCIILGIFLR